MIKKHNEANGEENRDGTDNNNSWNSGVEGETQDKAVLKLRERRARCLMASLLLSFGTPMILGGDEILKTAYGNNNVYAQDNIYSWINWPDITELGKRMQDLVKRLMTIRRTYPELETDDFINSENFIWYRPDGQPMENQDWQHYVRALSCRLKGNGHNLFFIFNAFSGPLPWVLPGEGWELILDTTDESVLKKNKITVPAWSVLVFRQEG